MRSVKAYLVIMSLLLVGALVAGVYVWYVVQQTEAQLESQTQKESEVTAIPRENSQDTKSATVDEDVGTTIDISSLSETQQTTIRTFGFEGESFTVTAEMVTCAESAIGKERFDAIIDGAAPTPLESLKLLPCFKK